MTRKFLLALSAFAAASSLSGCVVYVHGDDDDECNGNDVEVDDGVEMKLADLPAVVRATFEREGAGGSFREIEREVENGRTQYAGEVTVNGETWDIEVGEDGVLLSKERESDDDEHMPVNGDDDR